MAAIPHRIDTHHHILPTGYMAAERERILGVSHRLAPQLLGLVAGEGGRGDGCGGDRNRYHLDLRARRVVRRRGKGATSRAGLQRVRGADGTRPQGPVRCFAALPLPDIDGSLAEIAYAYDTLGVDGIGLLTNFADTWPGDPTVAPVFDELNRRKAVVYFHPTAAACFANLLPGIHAPLVEFAFDTTRAIVSLLFNGTFARCPGIRFIFSHGGGTLPMLAGRIAAVARSMPQSAQYPNGIMPEFKKLFYDVVSVFDPIGFNALRQMAGIERLLLGTDYPYWSTDMNVAALAKQELSPADLRAIERDNALALFPRFGR